MKFELTGKLHVKMDTQRVSEKFQKREFVVLKEEVLPTWTSQDYVKFQLTQDRCDILDGFNVNDELKVSFNIRGRQWEKDGKVSYFTNLEAWRVEKVNADTSAEAPAPMKAMETAPAGDAPNEFNDDLPF